MLETTNIKIQKEKNSTIAITVQLTNDILQVGPVVLDILLVGERQHIMVCVCQWERMVFADVAHCEGFMSVLQFIVAVAAVVSQKWPTQLRSNALRV